MSKKCHTPTKTMKRGHEISLKWFEISAFCHQKAKLRGIRGKKFLSVIQRVALEERKKLLKHLVGIRKGSTFAIPNDEGAERRE